MNKKSLPAAGPPRPLVTPHALTATEVLASLHSTPNGLGHGEAAARLQRYGHNALPAVKPPGIVVVFLHQFTSPLIYVLLAAALVSLAIREWSDAGFICAVLLLNAIIGTAQEYSAQRAATALQQLVTTRCRVLRDGDADEVDAEELVPGDIVLLESGERVAADMRLLASHDLEVDESLLTGESSAVFKRADELLPADKPPGDRVNMAFAGTLVNRGRARGVVTGTALHTELGHIASAVLGKPHAKAPLLVRMERFTRRVAILIGAAAVLMASVALAQGMPLEEIFLLAVALAVSAIPEGLPVALTVALAISMRRMARRHVIVRRLLAVEALGSCTCIATDRCGNSDGLERHPAPVALFSTPREGSEHGHERQGLDHHEEQDEYLDQLFDHALRHSGPGLSPVRRVVYKGIEGPLGRGPGVQGPERISGPPLSGNHCYGD